MTYYAFVQNGKINGGGQCRCLNDDIYNTEITEEVFNELDKYIAVEAEEEYEVPDYETITEEVEVIDYDEEGNPIGSHTEEREVTRPVMTEIEVEVPDYDEEGNIIGYHTETREVQQTHTETRTIYQIVPDPDYEEKQAQKERERIGNLKVTKRVFALTLQQLGISYSTLKEAIATNEQAQLEWDLCVELQRNNPLLDSMAVQFNVTPAQLDYIFRKANGEDVDES